MTTKARSAKLIEHCCQAIDAFVAASARVTADVFVEEFCEQAKLESFHRDFVAEVFYTAERYATFLDKFITGFYGSSHTHF